MDSITECGLISSDGSIPKEFNGYVSSLGASLISAGLLPTIIFFSQKGDSNDRHKIVKCLEFILRKNFDDALKRDVSLIMEIKTLVQNQKSTALLEKQLTDAAIALKLAIRTFPKSRNN